MFIFRKFSFRSMFYLCFYLSCDVPFVLFYFCLLLFSLQFPCWLLFFSIVMIKMRRGCLNFEVSILLMKVSPSRKFVLDVAFYRLLFFFFLQLSFSASNNRITKIDSVAFSSEMMKSKKKTKRIIACLQIQAISYSLLYYFGSH